MTEEKLRNDFTLLQKRYREDPKKHRIPYAVGCVCVAPTQPEDAEELYRQALEIFTVLESSGADFTAAWLARAHQELGILLSDRGDDENAEPHLRQALARYRQPMGHPAHRHVIGEKLAECAETLGTFLLTRGRFREGEKLVLEALEIHESLMESNPDPHRREAREICAALAEVYRSYGMTEEASITAAKAAKLQ